MIKKFKSINLAFRKLIYNERNDKDITLQEMFEQYREVFQNESVKKSKLNSLSKTNNHKMFNIGKLINGQSQNGEKKPFKNTLLELNNNNDFINNKNLNSQNNSNFSQKNTDSIKNHRLKVNDKNNNEENHENHIHLVRKEDQIEHTVMPDSHH